MVALADQFECLLLTSDGGRLRLWRQSEEGLAVCAEWSLDRPLEPTDFSRSDYSAIVREVLARHDVELVHIGHLSGHALRPPPRGRRARDPARRLPRRPRGATSGGARGRRRCVERRGRARAREGSGRRDHLVERSRGARACPADPARDALRGHRARSRPRAGRRRGQAAKRRWPGPDTAHRIHPLRRGIRVRPPAARARRRRPPRAALPRRDSARASDLGAHHGDYEPDELVQRVRYFTLVRRHLPTLG